MKQNLTLLITTFFLLSMSETSGQKPIFSFGVISDVQYCDCEPAGSRFYRLTTGRLREAVNSFRTDSVDFVVNLGDLIDRDYDSYKPVLDILDSSGLKVYHLRGNHDYSVDDRYKKHLPLPVPGKKGYYSFSQGNFRFIALDGNEVSTYATNNKSAIQKVENYLLFLKDSGNANAINWNGGISSSQLDWLKIQLDEAAEVKENVFILCHFPLFPDNMHNLLNYKDVNSLLGNYKNIVACFSGHNHSGNYGNFNMIHFVTMKGMVESNNSTSYAIVEVYDNKIWIRGAGREMSRILAY
jgi:manganese-dependent ADP-ribose/CDP-alcohol diphosphatase